MFPIRAGLIEADWNFQPLAPFALQLALQSDGALLTLGEPSDDFSKQMLQELPQHFSPGQGIFQANFRDHFRRGTMRGDQLRRQPQRFIQPLDQ